MCELLPIYARTLRELRTMNCTACSLPNSTSTLIDGGRRWNQHYSNAIIFNLCSSESGIRNFSLSEMCRGRKKTDSILMNNGYRWDRDLENAHVAQLSKFPLIGERDGCIRIRSHPFTHTIHQPVQCWDTFEYFQCRLVVWHAGARFWNE